jgi:metal-dependent amidase/aminoacylase/carboxypeptidase family protein
MHIAASASQSDTSRRQTLKEIIMAELTHLNSASLVLTNLSKLLPDLEPLYKDVHAHPELSMQETRTAGIAADRLRKAGYEVTTRVGKTGVVGLLRNGEGPTVMLRADMDALPIAENTGLAYASKVTATDAEGNVVPVGHMCGHDMHVAWLVAPRHCCRRRATPGRAH